MNKDRIQHLRTLCNSATPGPWKLEIASVHHSFNAGPAFEVQYENGQQWRRVCTNHDRQQTNCVASCYLTIGKLEYEKHNAAFIAEARCALPECLDRIEDLEGQIEYHVKSHQEVMQSFVDVNNEQRTRIQELEALVENRNAVIQDKNEDKDRMRGRIQELEARVRELKDDVRRALRDDRLD